jgi:hypothetical protein
MSSYADYLRSTHWLETRERILTRSGGVCERHKCKRRATQVHHKTYVRLGEELDSDLEALCVRCHQQEHPDKWALAPGWSYRDERACEMCPSLVADFFQIGKTVRAICVGCGHQTMEFRGTPGKLERQRNNWRREGPRCSECGFVSVNDYGLAQHIQALHRAARPTLEELEHERRERERNSVRARSP